MKLSGFSSIYNGPKSGLFPPTKRSSGTDFLDEVKNTITIRKTARLSVMFLISVEGFHGLAEVCVRDIRFMRNPFLRLFFRR